MFLPFLSPVAFWKPTCMPALVVARVQLVFIPGQDVERVRGFPTLPSNSFAADKCWFTWRAPTQNSLSSAGKKPSFLKPGLRWAVGTPHCSPSCVWGHLLCVHIQPLTQPGLGLNPLFFRCRCIAQLETSPLKSHLPGTSEFVFPWIGICQDYTIN